MVELIIEVNERFEILVSPKRYGESLRGIRPCVVSSSEANNHADHKLVFSFGDRGGFNNFDVTMRALKTVNSDVVVLGGISIFESAYIFADRITILVGSGYGVPFRPFCIDHWLTEDIAVEYVSKAFRLKRVANGSRP